MGEHFNRKWFFQIPEGALLGDTVTVHLPAVPPLDGRKRKHTWEMIRHPMRCGNSSHCSSRPKVALDIQQEGALTSDIQRDPIDEDIKRKRLDCYRSFQGRSMDPQLCIIEEHSDDERDVSAGPASLNDAPEDRKIQIIHPPLPTERELEAPVTEDERQQHAYEPST